MDLSDNFTSTPKRLENSSEEDIQGRIRNNESISEDLIIKENAILKQAIFDSSFDLADFQVIDDIISQSRVETRKSLSVDTPVSRRKYKKQKVVSPSVVQNLLQICNNDDSTVEEKESQLVTSNLQNILLSNAHNTVVLKTCERRRLDFQSSRSLLDTTFCSASLNNTVKEDLFFGLPLKVKQLIEDFKDIKELYSWQEECLNLNAIKEKKNLIYCLPTSGGKTLVAEILILREILCHRRNAIFVLPYVSIVQEKVRSLSPFALALGFLVEEYAAGRGQYPPRKRRWKQVVYVATIEKALGLVNSLVENLRLHELGLVVVDELHMLGEPGRGATLETLLTRLMYQQDGIQIIGMSATIGNLTELSKFLKADTYKQDFRPVKLREHVKLGQFLYLVSQEPTENGEEMLQLVRTLPKAPAKCRDPDSVGLLVSEVVPDSSCLVFCAMKQNCINVALLVCDALPRCVIQHRNEEKRALYHALVIEGGGRVCPTLKRTLPYGVAYHCSSLTMSERNLLEEGYRAGTLCCLCCTSTLAAGVNLPAKRVILRSPWVGLKPLSPSQYKQMVGRAGRAGIDTEGESILICQPEELSQVKTLLGEGMNECVSQLNQSEYTDDREGRTSTLEGLVLSSVCLGQTNTEADIVKLVKCSLLSTQTERLGIIVEQEVHNVINELSNKQVLTCKEDMQLSVSAIGRAAIKAHLTVNRAQDLQDELNKAQGGLNLLTPLHLLYVVTPPDIANSIRFLPFPFASEYKRLPAADQKTISLVGITEGVVALMLTGSIPRSVSLSLLKRMKAALMLRAVWEGASVWDVAHHFELPRGDVQSLMSAAAAFAANVQNFCQEMPERFWCFSALLGRMADRLAHCCSAELVPLMELPSVKKGRARQLYDAGYHTLNDVAGADPMILSQTIRHLPLKVARHIISVAHMLLLERAESLREDAEVLLEGVLQSNVVSTSHPTSPGTPERSTSSGSQMPAPHASWASPKLHSPGLRSHNTSTGSSSPLIVP